MHYLLSRSRVAIAIVTGVTITSVAAAVALAASSTPAGGSFRVFGVSSGLGGGGSVLVTGAIGDHGQTSSVNQNGTPNSNGNYVKLSLSQGTVTLNKTTLDQAINKAYRAAKLDSATCSVSVVASGTIAFVSGTGLYANAKGSAHATLAAGFIQPRFKSGANAGKCDSANSAKPVASQQLVTGTGTVSF